MISKNGTSLLGGVYVFSPEFRGGSTFFSPEFRGGLRFFPRHVAKRVVIERPHSFNINNRKLLRCLGSGHYLCVGGAVLNVIHFYPTSWSDLWASKIGKFTSIIVFSD